MNANYYYLNVLKQEVKEIVSLGVYCFILMLRDDQTTKIHRFS